MPPPAPGPARAVATERIAPQTVAAAPDTGPPATESVAPPYTPGSQFADRDLISTTAFTPPTGNEQRVAMTSQEEPLVPEVPEERPVPGPGPFVGPMDDPRMQARERAISGIESGGSRNPYGEVGIATKGGNALGKFQVMSNEIPERTQAALGYKMTPQEFLNNPNAQHIQFRQQFGDAVKKYGEEGAARNWYGGDRGMYNLGATDAHGRLTVAKYGQDYMNRLARDVGAEPGTEGVAVNSPGGGRGGGASVAGAQPSPGQPDPRDAVTMALLAQNETPQAPAAEEQPQGSDARLLELVKGGGRQPGSPFRATASLDGRGGAPVLSDAPQPGLQPMGALGGLETSAAERRDAITKGLVGQPQPAPEVPPPPPDPTQAGTSPSPTTSGPPTASDVPPLAGPTAQLAPGFRPDVGMFPSPQAPQAAQAPPPSQDTSQGIKPAPDMPPSRAPIPPASEQEMQPPGPAPVRPAQLGLSKAQANAMQIMNNPNITEGTRAYYKSVFDTEEGYRKEREQQNQADYINRRDGWLEYNKEYAKFTREAPDRTIKQLNDRIDTEIKQATATKAPLDIAKLRVDIQNAQADLEEKIYKTGTPRDQAKQEAALRIQELQKKINDPDKFESQGARYERPPGATEYKLAPGSPQPQMSAEQQKGVEFVMRSKADLQTVDNLGYGKALTDPEQVAKANIPIVGRTLTSQDYHTSEDALGNWGAGFLTRVSGAAVSPSEAMRNLPPFIPRLGDTDEDLRIKSQRRHNMVDAVGSTVGTQGMAIVKSLTDAYAKEDYAKEQAKPPERVATPADAMKLPPGRRIVLPDGNIGTVPRSQ